MIRIEKDITLSAEELAREFWELDCKQQADFFNKNKLQENSYHQGKALMQIDWLVGYLDDNGKNFIKIIYSSLQELEKLEKKKEVN